MRASCTPVSLDGSNFLPLGQDFTFYSPISVGSFTPSLGSSNGGTVVSVAGSNFDAARGVFCRFGSTVVKGSIVNTSAARCITPPVAAEMIVTLEVSTNGVDFSSSNDLPGFSFVAPPAVDSLSPRSGTALGGVKVLLLGSGFQVGDTFLCKFGGAAPSAGIRVNASALECATPAVSLGSSSSTSNGKGNDSIASRLRVPVRLSTNGGTDFLPTFQNFYFKPELVVTAATPLSGSESGGTEVSLRATGVITETSGYMCRFGAVAVKASLVHFDSAGVSVLRCLTPAVKVQTVDVEISSDGAQFAKTGFVFSFIPDMTITSATPTDVLQGSVVNIVGEGLHEKLACIFGSVGVSKAIFVNSTVLQCRVPELSSAGRHEISVRSMVDLDVAGGYHSSNSLTLVYHPTVNMHSVTPTMGTIHGGTVVKIFASNLKASDALRCRFRPLDGNGDSISPLLSFLAAGTYLDSRHMSCETPNVYGAFAGNAKSLAIDVMGEEEFVRATSDLRFHLHNKIAISSFGPASATTTGGSLITISGSNFVRSTSVSCKFAGSKVVAATYISKTMLQCTSPALDIVGDVELAVAVNGVDFVTAALPLKIQKAMVLVEASPAEGPLSGGSVVTLTGSGFVADAALRCLFGGMRESPATYVSATAVRCTTPRFVSAKTVSLQLAVSGNVVSHNTLSFTLNAHSVLEGIFPGNGPAAGGTVVKIFGVDFNTTSKSIQVSFGSSNVVASGITVLSSTEIEVVSPPSSTGGAQMVPLEVSTDSGSTFTSYGLQFSYESAFSAVDMAPVRGNELGGTSVYMKHSYTDDVLRSSRLKLACRFGSSLARGVVIDAETLMCQAPQRSPGIVAVAITLNGQNFYDTGFSFTYVAAPRVTALDPAIGRNRGGSLVRIRGSNFLDSSRTIIRFSGSFGVYYVVGTFMNSTLLEVSGQWFGLQQMHVPPY